MSFNLIIQWWENNTRMIQLLIEALGQTLNMVFSSGLIGFAIGIPLGVLLHISKKKWLT